MSQLIPRDGIVEIVGHRRRALELYEGAFKKIEEAAAAVREAESAVSTACGGERPHAYTEPHEPEVEAFRSAVKLPDASQFMRVARRITDIQVWGSLIERTDMAHLMDKQAKDELRGQMAYIPEQVDARTGAVINSEEISKGLPEISVEAVEATLRGLVEDSGRIFRRGIANAFAELDRRFRSHDGFKIGSRVILSHAFDEWGSWNYYRNHQDTLTDIERVFLVLDGKGPRASYAGIVGAIQEARRGGGCDRRQSEHEGDYFRVRIFKNGNAHLWFTRKDLVEKVNQQLAQHYGEGLGWGRFEEEQDDPLQERAVGHARNFGYFPTPDAVADRVTEEARLWKREEDPPLRALEPSAGTGTLARRMVEQGHRVDVVEIQPELARELEASGLYARVRVANFLELKPEPVYDRIVMNPPFDRGRDIDHVAHAWDFLKPGGTLVAIMAAGTEFREDRKARAFRKLMDDHGAEWRDLPQGAFSEAGTNVNTLYVRATKR